MDESKNKENVPQGISITTPTRPKTTTLNSPAQTKSLWDSSDPMRNPPPLPLSPQMLRTSGGKTKGSNQSSPVGKLQFTAVDTTEIEYQLQKVLETQNSLKTLLQGIDTSVKHTQLDLDNLQQRSSNNNSHLKNLLENVSAAASAVGSATSTSLTSEELKKIISDTEDTLLLKIEEIDAVTHELKEGLAKIASSTSTETDPLLLQGIDEIKKKIDTIPTNSDNAIVDEVRETMSTHSQKSEELKSLLTSSQGEFKGSLKTLQDTVSGLSIDQHMTSLKDSQSSFEEKIKNHVESLKTTQSTDDIEKTHASLAAIADEIKSLREESKKSLTALTNQSDVSERLSSLESLVRDVMTTEHAKLNDGFVGHLDKIQTTQKDILDNSTLIHKAHSNLTEKLDPQLEQIVTHMKDLRESLSSQLNTTVSSELEKKELELSLKDKEIESLKAQLEEEKAKQTLSSTVMQLNEEKTKLETKLEGLQQVYKTRYEDLRSLSKEHEDLNQRWIEFNTEKLRSITGTAAFTRMTLEESKLESPSYKNSSALGSRVLSTNSYLSNRRSTLSPKPRKVYDLAPIEGGEEKENF